MDIRLSINENSNNLLWYVHLGSLPFCQYLNENQEELPCDLDMLYKSTESDGVYPLFICNCGDKGCASYWIKVTHKKDKITWTTVYEHNENGEQGKRIADIDWILNKEEYVKTIKSAIELRTLILN